MTKQTISPQEQEVLRDKGLELDKTEQPEVYEGLPSIPYEYHKQAAHIESRQVLPQYQTGLMFEGWQRSKYDEGTPFEAVTSEGGIQDWRAQQQTRREMWANAAPQFLTTAVTSFASGTLGLAFGTVETLFGGDFVDESFTNLMLDIQDWSAETFPIYSSVAYEESPWYQQMGAADFWANIVINQGFTAGTVAAAALTGGILRAATSGMRGFQLARGMSGASRGGQLGNLGRQVRQGQIGGPVLRNEIIGASRNLQRTDKLTQWLSAAHGSAGYAKIEALGHGRQLREKWEREIEIEWRENLPKIVEEVREHINTTNPDATPEVRRALVDQELRRRKESSLEGMDEVLKAHINTTFALDWFYLTLTNQAMFGRLFSGNYGVSRGALARSIAPKAGKAAVRANPQLLKQGIEEARRTGLTRYKRPLTYLAKNPTIQFFEESFLHINRETSGDFYSAIYNEEATHDLNTLRTSYFEMMADTFGDIDNWESGMMGFFGGMLGAAGPVTRGGRVQGYGMTGGIWDFARGVRDANRQKVDSRIIEGVNAKLQDDRLQKMYRSAVRRHTFEKEADRALVDGDKFTYENKQFDAFLNDLFLFDDLGLTQEFLDYIDTGQHTSAEQIREFYGIDKTDEGVALDEKRDVFEGMEDTDLERAFSETSRAFRKYAHTALDHRQSLSTLINHREFTDNPVLNQQYQEAILTELTYLATSVDQMSDRLDEVKTELPGELQTLGDEIFQAVKERDTDKQNELNQRQRDLLTEHSNNNINKKRELFTQLDNYVALITRLDNFGDLYEALETDEGAKAFIEGIENIRKEAAEKNKQANAEATVGELSKEHQWTPEVESLLTAASTTTEGTVDGEPVAQTYFGQIEIHFADQEGVPTGESALFAIDRITDQGRVRLNQVTKLTGEGEGVPTHRSKDFSFINKDGTITHKGKTGQISSWDVITTGEQARQSFIRNKVSNLFKTELDNATTRLENLNLRIVSAESFRNNIRKRIQEYDSIPTKFKATKEISGFKLSDNRIRETLKRALTSEEYRDLNIDSATSVTLTVSQLEGVVSELDNVISALESEKNSVQETLSNVQDMMTDVEDGDITGLENTVERINEYLVKNQESLDSAISVRNNLRDNLRKLKAKTSEVDKEIKDLEYQVNSLTEATKRKLTSEDPETTKQIDEEISAIEGIIRDLYKEKLKTDQEIFIDESTIRELDRNIEDTQNLIKSLQEGQKLRQRLIDNFNSIVFDRVAKKAAQEAYKKKSSDEVETALQEQYEEKTEQGIYRPKWVGSPMQRFTGSIANFQRTTAAQHEYRKEPALYEPQLRFQEFIDSYNPTSNRNKLRGYTWAQLQEAVRNEEVALKEDQLENLRGYVRDDYSVFLVITDKKGTPVKVDSFQEDGTKTSLLSVMPDLKGRDGVYRNERPKSKQPIVDLEKHKADLINKKNYTEDQADIGIQENFVKKAQEFDQKVREEVFVSEEPVLFHIVGKTQGKVQTTSEPLRATETLVDSEEQLKDLDVVIPISSEYVTKHGEPVAVDPGFIFVEEYGTLIPAQRVRLESPDAKKVLGALRGLMLDPSQDNYTKTHELINTYTYFIHESRTDKLSENSTYSRFHVISDKAGKELAGVQIGDTKVSREELLSGDQTAENTVLSFLEDKFYNIDRKRLKSNLFPVAEKEPIYTYDESGNITGVELGVTNKRDYKRFIFGDKENTPKLLFNIPPKPTSSADAVDNPRYLNRSFIFAPKTKTRKADEGAEKTTTKKSDVKPSDIINKKSTIKQKFNQKKENAVSVFKKYKDEVEKKASETKKGKTTKSDSEKEAITGENITAEPTKADVENSKKLINQINKGTNVKSSEANKKIEAFKKVTGKTRGKLGIKPGRIEFTTTSDSPSTTSNINLEAQRAMFERIFKGVTIYKNGLEAMQSDAMLDTMDGIVKIFINPNAAEGTLWHEGFHIVNLLFNSNKERQDLYQEARDYLGEREVQIGNETLVGNKLNDAQTEEYLAEQFRSYMLVGKNNYKFPKTQQKRKTFFERVWDSILTFFGLSDQIKDRVSNDPSLILEQFDKIAGGVYDVKTLENIKNVRVNKIGEEDIATSIAMVKGLNHVFFNNLFLSDEYSGAELLYTLENYLGDLYDLAKESFEITSEALKSEGQPTNFIDSMLENWTEVAAEHYNSLKQYKLQLNQFEDQTSDETSRGKDATNWFESNRIDHRELMQAPLKILLASIADYGPDGSKITIGAVPQSINHSTLINKLHFDLANTRNLRDMFEVLENKAEDYPPYRELLTKLEVSSEQIVPENADIHTLNLISSFFHQFNKSQSGYNTYVLGDENSYFVESISATAEGRLIDNWKSAVKLNLPETTSLFSLIDGRYKVDPDGTVSIFEESYSITDLTPKKLAQINKDNPNSHLEGYKDFLRAFGINLGEGVQQFESIKILSEAILNQVNKGIKKGELLAVEDIFDRDVVKAAKEVKQLAHEQSKLQDDVVFGQFINSKGQVEYSIKLKHYIDKLLDHLQSGEVPAHLKPFDGQTGSFLTYGSRWLNRTDIRRTILRNLGLEREEKVDLESLSPGDYALMQMESVLNGTFPFMRSSDRKLELGFEFGKNEVSIITPEFFREELIHYLEGELVYALAFRNIPEFSHFNKKEGDKGLGFFKDILPNIEKLLERPNYQNLNKEDFITEAQKIISENKEHISSTLDNYIQESNTRLKHSSLEQQIFARTKLGATPYKVLGISTQTLESLNLANKKGNDYVLSEEGLSNILNTVNYYYTTAGIEQTKLITGPLNIYKKGNASEFHKRTNLFTSTSNSTITDRQYVESLDTLFPRIDGLIRPDVANRTEYYRDIVVNDVDVASEDTQYQMIKSAIGDKAAGYLNQTENDAAGLTLLDGYRDYELRTTGQWNEAKERSFQYESQLLFEKFVEKGYITENQYREFFKDHIPRASDIKYKYYKGERITPDNITPFSVKKPISRGDFANEVIRDAGRKQTTKTAISLLLPSDYISSDDAIEFMYDAMLNGIDFIFPVSAKKGEFLGDAEGQPAPFYNEDGTRSKISDLVDRGHMIEEIFWEGMGDQVDVDPAGHNNTADSSQQRRLTYIDSFNAGESVPGFESITQTYQNYVNLYNTKIDKQLESLVDTLGLEEATEGEFNLVKDEQFMDLLLEQLDNRTLPENSVEAVKIIFNSVNDIKLFDSVPTKRQIVNILQALVRNRAVNLKTSGDMLVQQAVTGTELSPRRSVQHSNHLKFYRLLDSEGNETTDINKATSVTPSEVMVSVPRDWLPYINSLPGETFEQKLNYFNENLINTQEFQEMLTMSANRIPSDHLHSLEVIRVVRFLSPQGGPRVVLPTEIVTKSGADFDVDKLSTYFNNIATRGTEKPQLIRFERDKNKLWDIYQTRTKSSQEALETLRDLGVDTHSHISYENFVEQFDSSLLTQNQRQQIFDILGTSNLERIHNKLFSPEPILNKEEFFAQPIEKLNSVRAIENEINRIRQQILLNPKNYASLVTPNNQDAVDRVATAPQIEKVSNHSLLELNYNNKVAYNQFQGKALVGIGANNSSAHSLQQIHPVHITSPAFQIVDSSFDVSEGNLFFGHIYDQKYKNRVNKISETNGAILSAAVDAGKDVEPAIVRANITTSTANTYSYLNRLGSSNVSPLAFERVAEILNSPIVREFENRRRLSEALFLKNKNLKKEKGEIFNNLLEERNQARPKKYVPLYEAMENYIKAALTPGVNSGEAESLVLQKLELVKNDSNLERRNLELFLYYQEASKVLNMIQRLTRPDAGLAKDRHTVKLRRRELDRLLASGIVDATSLRGLLENSYLKNFNKAHQHSERMFADFHLSEVSQEFNNFLWGEDGVVSIFEDPIKNLPEDKRARAAQKLENAAISYILHTTKVGRKALNERYGDLVKGENSLPKRIGRAKTVPGLTDNPALVEFTPMIEEYNYLRETQHEIDYLQTFNRRYTTEETNVIVDGIRELVNHEDQAVRQVGHDLIDMSIIQSGVQISPVSFFELLPADLYHKRFMDIVNNYFDENNIVLNEQAKTEIFSNLAHDRLIVPRARRPVVKKDSILVNKKSATSEYEYLSYKDRLYKKAGEGHTATQAQFNLIHKKGDGQRMFEAYRTPKKSGISSNNVRGLDPTISSQPVPTTQQTPPTTQQSQDYYQQTRQTDLAPNQNLNESIQDFLNKIGVTYKSVDTIVDNLGRVVGNKNEGVAAIARIAQQTVEVVEGRADRLTLPEEAAHFYVELLRDNDSLLLAMKNQIVNYDIYNEVQSEYGELYGKNQDKLKKEAIGKLIAAKISEADIQLTQRQKKQSDNWLRSLWRKVKNFFDVKQDPFKKAAFNILEKRIDNLDMNKLGNPEAAEYFRRNQTDKRLSVLDDVAAAQKAEADRVAKKERAETQMEQVTPKSSSQTKQTNQQELRKVSERDLAIQDIFRNFDHYFPHYSNLSSAEKLAFAESMDMLNIIC